MEHHSVDLSVLICSTHTRWQTFGQAIQRQIWAQEAALPEADRARVEIIMLTDNKQMMLGAKRNAMIDICQGRYVAFVDDDDRLEDRYLPALLEAVEVSDADVITFRVSVAINGADPLQCVYSKNFRADRNLPSRYERLPNHLMCVKRDLARRVSFPHIAYGEDSGYSKLLAPHLKTEHAIDEVLYHYDYNDQTTEAQEHKRNATRTRSGAPLVDVVILSHAHTPALRRMTQQAIRSATAGANGLPINVIVMEQHDNTRYRFAHTQRCRGDFNYNRRANQGAELGAAEWIMIANNDLRFEDGWLHKLLAADHPIVSPKDPGDARQEQITENTVGDVTARHFSGWCFMIRRALWKEIGGFDDCVNFWFSDDVVIEQLKAVGVQPMLVPGARVQHLQSVTLRQRPDIDDLTWAQLEIFEAKYGPHRLHRDPRYLRWKRRDDRSNRRSGGAH
jgi:GT2 family glycosyltransferase